MRAFFTEILLALKSYLYGIGWLTICVFFVILAFRLFTRHGPVDVKKELEKQNMALALMLGLWLLGLTFGILYLAAHIS